MIDGKQIENPASLIVAISLLMGLGSASNEVAADPIYNGGPVLGGMTTVNLIYYGWGSQVTTVQPIFNNFISGISGTNWWGITRFYSDRANSPLGVQLGQSIALDASTYGTSLNQSTISSIARNSPQAQGNNLNLVLTGPSISVANFGVTSCGWHAYSGSFVYGFVGNAQNAPTCIDNLVQFRGDPIVGGMLSVIAHELTEAISDPYLSAWKEPGPQTATSGRENADMCAWKYSGIQHDSFGAFNQSFGGQNYLIQDNWLLGQGIIPSFCSFTELPKTTFCRPGLQCKPDFGETYDSPLAQRFQSDIEEPEPEQGTVPEPSMLTLLGVGLMCLCFAHRMNLPKSRNINMTSS